MKKLFLVLSIIVLLGSGCSFDAHILTPLPVEATAPPLTPTAFFSSIPDSTPTGLPVGFTPDSTASLFYAARAVIDPNDTTTRSAFPVGTRRIYVVWNYQNMREGMTVKRKWYLDGKPWLQREESWNFAKYGASGTMRDVSIYDENVGLPSGVYQLQVYIEGIQQPIGVDTMFGPENWLNFEVQSVDEAISAASSPDNLWSTYIYGKKRIVLHDTTGTPKDIFTGREINYLTWFADGKHFLFVDRDYSGQQAGSPLGVRDELYIVDVATGQVTLLYKADSRFQGYGGPQPSLDGKYISGLLGSGFGDACFMDSSLIFFEVAGDFESVKAIEQKNFSGVPSKADSVVYPAQEGAWRAGNQYAVTLIGTCGIDPSLMGAYVFDVPNRKATLESASSTPSSAGDLGWGEVHGVVTDAVTGKAIAGATITCEHSSYTSPSKCSGSTVTGIPGVFVFQNVFFHDTDTIKLTVSAPGYQTQEITQNSFTTNDMTGNFSLTPLP